jgi:hypothetical protein
MIDTVRIHLFWKITIYYGVCFALVIAVGLTHPEWMNFLPFGGIDALQDDLRFSTDSNSVDQLLKSNRPLSLFDDAMNLMSAMAGTLIVMIPLRWVYMTESLKKSWNTEVAASLLLLPLVVTAIVYIVKFSLPLAFALAGIFAGVRYRSTLKSQSDAFFIFASIAVGLSAGTRSLGIALVLAVFFACTMLAAPPRHNEPPTESASDVRSAEP